jgi:hypothetical protein
VRKRDREKRKKGRKEGNSEELVAHTCNPSFLGGLDKEDCSSRPAQAKKLARSHLKTNKWMC